MALATLFLTCCLPTQANLYETAEWNEYQRKVRSAATYQVKFFSWPMGSVARPRFGLLTVRGQKFVLESDERTVYWDGKLATSYSKIDNARRVEAKQPDIGVFEFFGSMPKEVDLQRPLVYDLIRVVPEVVWRVPGERQLPRDVVGWKLAEVGGIDYRRGYEFWFDKESSLLSRVVEEGGGLGSNYRCSYDLEWDMAPKLSPDFFVPRPHRIEELTTGPLAETSSWRRVRAREPIPGKGRIIVRVPKGAEANVEVHTDIGAVSTVVRDQPFVAELQPGAYPMRIGVHSMPVRVREGVDCIMKVGAIQPRGNTLSISTEQSGSFATTRAGSTPYVVLPGIYYVKVGSKFKKVVVVEGKVTKF